MASNNPFDEEGSPDSTPPATRQAKSTKSSQNGPSKSLEDIAEVLLEEKLILTALELNTELLESGKEIAKLRDYFSNPGNFEHVMPQVALVAKSDIMRTPSMSTFDSLELGRYSDDGKEVDERVAVLEFELRKAQDTIKSLRGSLTKASDIHTKGEEIRQNQTNKNEPIKPHEKRALNYLVHEYLNSSDSMLTAITLAEESGDQNLDDWDDVGLNIPKPPALLQQFRHYDSLSLGGHEQVTRMNHMENEIKTLNAQILALRRENESLQLKIKRQSNLALIDGAINQQSRRTLMDASRRAFTPEAPRTNRSKESSIQLDSKPLALFQDNSNNNEPGSPEHKKPVDSPTSTSLQDTSSSSIGSPQQQHVSPEHKPTPPDSRSLDNNDKKKGEDITDNKDASDCEDRKLPENTDSVSSPSNTSHVSPPPSEDKPKPEETVTPVEGIDRNMSVSFRQELLSVVEIKIDSKIGIEVSKLAEPDLNVVELFGRCLPDIVSNVILAKRDELIPVLLCVISRHGNHKERDKLLQILFNLIKRPDEVQRQMIMSGCVAFVKLGGQVEAELFPQIWEQIDHKFYERRLLVAESCGILVPHIQPALRGSLVLSVLQQMLHSDKGEGVRQAVVKSLGILVSFIDDTEKFKQCWELLLTSINDTSKLVSSAALTVFLPAMAAWSYELDKLESDLILYFLEQLYTCVKQVCRSDGESGATERCQQHIITLTHIVPWHYTSILYTGPFASNLSEFDELVEDKATFPQPFSRLLDVHVIVGDDAELYRLMAGLDKEIEKPSTDRRSWDKLDWLINECFKRLLRSIEALGFSQSEVLHSLTTLVSTYCCYFGHTFTHTMIKPLFLKHLTTSKESEGSGDPAAALSSTLLPVYVCGVLTSFKKDEPQLVSYLQDCIIDLSLSYTPMDSLKATISEMKRDRRLHPLLIKLLDDLSTHSAIQVRRNVTTLTGLMIDGVDEKLTSNNVIKTLLRLASDSEMQVRIQSVESLGVVMETMSNREVLNNVHKQFESFASQTREDFLFYETMLRTLARIVPNADPVFRDEFIIPFLTNVAAQNNEAPNMTQRRDVAHVLLESYKGLSGCFVSGELLSSYIIPALKALMEDFEVVDQANLPSVKQLLQDGEEKLANHHKQSGGESLKDPTSNLLSKFTPKKMSFSFKKN